MSGLVTRRAGVRRELLSACQRHLRTHLRPIGGEERQQRVAPRITARGAIAAHERRGQVRAAGFVQLHDEERQVSRDVDVAQPVIELDAVDHLDVALEQHVLEPEVAVSIADPAAGGAAVELVPHAGEERRGEPLGGSDSPPLRRFPQQAPQRREVVVERPLDRFRAIRAPLARSIGVKARKPSADRRQLHGSGRAGRNPPRERRVLRVPPHLDRIVHGIGAVLRAELQTAVRCRDQRPHAEIYVGGEPAIESDLGTTHRQPSRGRSVVDVRQHQRLLDLVRPVAGEEDPRDVRLADGFHGLLVQEEVRSERGCDHG